MAERAAWEFMEGLPESERFGLTTVNPGFITGPSLINGGFASAEIMNMFMSNNFPGGVPQVQMPIVDVRDVALAHVNCIKNEQAQGKRFILCGEVLWFREIGEKLARHFGP